MTIVPECYGQRWSPQQWRSVTFQTRHAIIRQQNQKATFTDKCLLLQQLGLLLVRRNTTKYIETRKNL